MRDAILPARCGPPDVLRCVSGGANEARSIGSIPSLVRAESGACDRERSGATGPWWITPHAVRRYIQRCPGARRLTYDQALGRLIDEAGRAHLVKARRNAGEELWRGGKPHRLRFVVARGNSGLPQLVTVLRGCDATR